jgi:hypothetical protein
MDKLNPIPSGPQLQNEWRANKPKMPPELPTTWSASVLLTPFGDAVAPRRNSSQLAVARIESASSSTHSWMRVKLYLTQELLVFDFLFVCVDGPDQDFESNWYWIDSFANSGARIFGPFRTTLRVPGPKFLLENNVVWGNRYPLMCTDTNRTGIDCNHWLVPTPGPTNHGTWYAFRRDTGNLFRIATFDSNNPMMIPILGAYFLANLESVQAGTTEASNELVRTVVAGSAVERTEYWNPMVTQQDIARAMAFPIAARECTIEDLEQVLPGFATAPAGAPLPAWSENAYIEGWALGLDLIPYFVRVCYRYTGAQDSREHAVFIGQSEEAHDASYLKRGDACLDTTRTDLPYFEWNDWSDSWQVRRYRPPIIGVGLHFPDWLARSHAAIRAQIRGNPNFGLKPDEILNLIVAEVSLARGELSNFWAWYLESGVGMLFAEGKYLNPLSHLLQVTDYNLFLRNAPITSDDFSDPCQPDASPPPR